MRNWLFFLGLEKSLNPNSADTEVRSTDSIRFEA